MTWTTERVAKLERLWQEGLTTAEIGRLLGISKNAVVGKAHRLRLPSRQSPIRREAKAAPVPREVGAGACQWPIGDPVQPGFGFCGAPVVPGKPYCAQHCAVAYTRVSVPQQPNEKAA
jgi:GcrA cell cycle regulator